MDEVLRRNGVSQGILYVQMTRGIAQRVHAWPEDLRPVITVLAYRVRPPSRELMERGVDVMTIPDMRWKRNDIKAISLLANVLAKHAARDARAHEAWLVDSAGFVTEGASTTAWIVDRNGTVITRPLDEAILAGVTRGTVLDLATAGSIAVEERPFMRDEALSAHEAFLTSTSSRVLPVTRIDGHSIDNGRPGKTTLTLARHFGQHLLGGVDR